MPSQAYTCRAANSSAIWVAVRSGRVTDTVGTRSATRADRTAGQMAEHLAARQVYAWDGNFYALELTRRLGLEDRGGLVRLGLVHYNTADEIDRLMTALDEL